jgi:hypothetical protein
MLGPLKVALPVFTKAGTWRQNVRHWVNAEPLGEIDLPANYRWFELLADTKVSEYVRREIPLCPSLAQLSPELVNKLIQAEMVRAKAMRRSLIALILVCV